MSTIPEPMLAVRKKVAERCLRGQGIEIGALHHPLCVPEQAQVRYVDRLSVDGLRHHYPELNTYNLVPVDVVDDGEKLHQIPDGSLDFIIANHFLEHTENPLGTIRKHLRKLRKGGTIYYAIPDKRYSFDTDRELTSFTHLVVDDLVGVRISRKRHYRQWTRHVLKEHDVRQVREKTRKLIRANYSIHFHVWDETAFRRFLERARLYLRNAFSIEQYLGNVTEVIAILKKT